MRTILKVALLACLAFAPFFSLSAKMPDEVTGEFPRSYWQLLFLFEKTSTPGQTEFVVRPILPIYGRYTNAERGYTFNHTLYPVFYWHGTYNWQKWSVLHLISGTDRYHTDTKDDTDLMLSPLLHWGRGKTSNEKYFAFFPLAGKIKGKLGFSEINFLLFPLYINWAHDEYRAHSVLWPLTLYGRGPNRKDYRFLPFFSHKVYQGKYSKTSVLWPFIQWGKVDLDKKEPRKYWYFFPFYARKWSDNRNLSVHGLIPLLVLPPLFSWGVDKKTKAFHVNVLWFLYQYGRSDSPYLRKHIIFPFWGYYRFAEKEANFISPFYINLKNHNTIYESRTHIVTALVPIYWSTKRHYLKDWKTQTFLKIWPFFHYIKDTRGNLEFRSLVLWPTRADKFERIWGPIYSLVEYRRFENGDRYFSLFLRIYSQYWNPREYHLFLLGFEYHKTPDYWSVLFLGGMFGFRHDYERPAARISPYSSPGRSPVDSGSKNTVRLFWFRI